MLKVIFLDIDGVLLPFPRPKDQPPNQLFPNSTLKALKRLYEATKTSTNDSSSTGSESATKKSTTTITATTTQWVLSSTWRVQRRFINDILDALNEYGIPLDDFHDITDPAMHSERQWEIYDWLGKKGRKQETSICWLALDDEELIEGDENQKYKSHFENHVIKTESSIGLTEADVDQAIQLWNHQLGKKQEQKGGVEGSKEEDDKQSSTKRQRILSS